MIPLHWFKVFAEWGSDPKVQSMSESLQRRLIMLWCLRCQADLTGLTEKEIALYLHISLPALEKTRAVFVGGGSWFSIGRCPYPRQSAHPPRPDGGRTHAQLPPTSGRTRP